MTESLPTESVQTQPLPAESVGPAPEQLVDKVDRIGEIANVGEMLLKFDLDDEDDAWLDEASEVADSKADKAAQLYNAGVEVAEGEEVAGITKQDMDTWFDSLSPEAKEYEQELRQKYSVAEARKSLVAERLAQQAPELLEGKLPADLEVLIGPNYVMGANQSGIASFEEAGEELASNGGVNMMEYESLSKRFAMFDKDHPDAAKAAVVSGYYDDPRLGRFVIAVPIDEGSPSREIIGLSSGPADLGLRKPDGHRALNARYVVGFIDNEGTLHRNANFMISNEPNLVAPVQQTAEDWL